jgi:hypothetical protein
MEEIFKNIKPASKKLYIANITRLNGGNIVDIDDLDFLEDPQQILTNLLEKGLKATTVRSYFISICSLLSNLKPRYTELPQSGRFYDQLYTKYYQILTEQNKELSVNNTKSNTQIANWITQEDVIEVHRALGAKAISENKYEVILDWLILSLYVLIPPRRILDYTQMMVVTEELEDDPTKNYWFVRDKQFIFSNYKTAGTYHTQVVDIPDSLDFVLKIYLSQRPPTGPLLLLEDGTPILENYNITRRLNRIFGKKISVSLLRNIFLTDTFKENKIHLSNIATSMGTSVSTIQSHYIKLD